MILPGREDSRNCVDPRLSTPGSALQSRCKRVPNEPIPTYGHSWPQRQSVGLKYETDRARRNGETAIGGRYATRRVVLTPGAE